MLDCTILGIEVSETYSAICPVVDWAVRFGTDKAAAFAGGYDRKTFSYIVSLLVISITSVVSQLELSFVTNT